jgi:manganese-dependent ADP-ribose/CDP-alcohol diphosphatase
MRRSPHAETGHSFHGTPRYYKDALEKAKRAVESFKKGQVDVVLHLGDIVDFHAAKHDVTEVAFEQILEQTLHTVGPDVPVLHCVGNHCLYNLERRELNSRLGIDARADQRSYYVHRVPEKRLAIAVLDGYDISILGTTDTETKRGLAEEILNTKNPNDEKNSNAGLEGLEKRFVKFGGGVGAEQLSWLEQEIEESRRRKEKMIVASHICIHPGTCVPTCLLWNYDEVLSILQANADVVVATLAGHAHRGGYCRDEAGIHHRVAEAILECPVGSDCHAYFDVYDDRIVVEGFGYFADGESCTHLFA